MLAPSHICRVKMAEQKFRCGSYFVSCFIRESLPKFSRIGKMAVIFKYFFNCIDYLFCMRKDGFLSIETLQACLREQPKSSFSEGMTKFVKCYQKWITVQRDNTEMWYMHWFFINGNKSTVWNLPLLFDFHS